MVSASIFKRNRIHLFWHVFTFHFHFLFEFVCQARQEKSKWDCISALPSYCFGYGVRKPCLRYKNFNLPFIFPRTFEAVASPDSLLSRMQPRYTNSGCCFICTTPCLISTSRTLFSFLFVPKRMDFVLSSPKCILNLLSTNQSKTDRERERVKVPI